jgi:hypothetical protein
MLLAVSAFKGYQIEASDGAIGTCSDLLFDDRSWRVRWLVVDTGKWLTGRRVLLHPSALGAPDHEHHELPAHLTKAQIEASPDLGSDQPVSAQMESSLYGYYGWDPLWGGSGFGGGSMATPLSAPALFGADTMRDASVLDIPREAGDPHLRSTEALSRYHIHAVDGAIGHLENLLIDDAAWGIRYLIVDTRNWWPGKHVLLSPYAVTDIDWAERNIRLDITRTQVKASPPWDPIAMIDQVYEKALHHHYNWPGYGW